MIDNAEHVKKPLLEAEQLKGTSNWRKRYIGCDFCGIHGYFRSELRRIPRRYTGAWKAQPLCDIECNPGRCHCHHRSVFDEGSSTGNVCLLFDANCRPIFRSLEVWERCFY
jgi:hypothetical protein